MEGSLVPVLVAAVAVFVVWKFLKGVVKTLALIAVLVLAALFVFGGIL